MLICALRRSPSWKPSFLSHARTARSSPGTRPSLGAGAAERADEEEEEEEEEEEGLPGLELIPGRAALPKLATLPRLSARNESAAWAALESLCRAALDRYHTSLDDDEAALAPPALKGDNNALPMFSNAWNARVHVRGEKRILSHLRRVAMRQQREEEEREGGGR